MSTINIPSFIKNMGHRILSFILNVDEESAKNLIAGNNDLDENRAKILTEFIQVIRGLRLQAIDEGDVDLYVFTYLPQIMQGDQHIFNIWRGQVGGQSYALSSQDPIILIASRIALEIYPLLLIELPSNSYFSSIGKFSCFNSVFYKLSGTKLLMDMILRDPSLSKLFTTIGNNEMDTICAYMTSTGRGGSIQLALFPQTLIANAYELMMARGIMSQDALIEAITEVVNMLRDIAEGRKIEVPVFMGFDNVGLDDLPEMDVEWGKIRPYNNSLIELARYRPTTLAPENKFLGFILESRCPYKVDLGSSNGNRWPSELEESRRLLEIAKENLCFTLALAVPRTPPLGLSNAWTLFVDPLCMGPSISWSINVRSPMPFYLLKKDEQESIKYWSTMVSKNDNHKIRIAVRRILSSINDRLNPIDGFIDAIIAWENLFGGYAELSYRISISIAKLLKEDKDERKILKNILVNLYNDRSKIVHGVKEITHDDAIKKRNQCLNIALEVIRTLYEHHPELLNDPNRSENIALK